MDPVVIITGVIADVGTAIEGVAGPALLVGAGVLALSVGWRVARKFVKA